MTWQQALSIDAASTLKAALKEPTLTGHKLLDAIHGQGDVVGALGMANGVFRNITHQIILGDTDGTLAGDSRRWTAVVVVATAPKGAQQTCGAAAIGSTSSPAVTAVVVQTKATWMAGAVHTDIALDQTGQPNLALAE